jgi:hypothetical protein
MDTSSPSGSSSSMDPGSKDMNTGSSSTTR